MTSIDSVIQRSQQQQSGIRNLLYCKKLIAANGFENFTNFFRAMPFVYKTDLGKIIYNRRNQIREIEYGGYSFIIKSYKIPHLINRLVYGLLRPSKAKRSYEYAEMLRLKGFGSPQPVAHYSERFLGILFGRSYFVSLKSECPYTYEDVMHHRIAHEEDVLKAIGQTTARLHNAGMIHMDYSRGNILIGIDKEGKVNIELIDLNRIRFRKISLKEGLDNLFERLPTDEHQHAIMEKAYLENRSL
jgi:hypothetical protein